MSGLSSEFGDGVAAAGTTMHDLARQPRGACEVPLIGLAGAITHHLNRDEAV
jgi:hypothetical protein